MPERRPYGSRGRFVPRRCQDPNCDGELVLEHREPGMRGYWRCDGLTHLTDTGPLIACEASHFDGEPFARA